jgi:hypothetical protein
MNHSSNAADGRDWACGLRLARALSGAALPLLLAACSGAPESVASESPATEGQTVQAFAESSCASAAADFTCSNAPPSCGSTSGSTYGHSNCTDAFVGVYQFNTGVKFIKAVGPSFSGSFPCNAAWVRTMVWQKIGTADWKPIFGDHTEYGSGDPSQGCTAPTFTTGIMAQGIYKIAAQAGVIFTLKPVTIDGWPIVVINGLTSLKDSLSSNGLTSRNAATGLPTAWPSLETPEGRMTMKYAIGCALPADRTVTLYDADMKAHTFSGEVGVAPEWETQVCGEACQESVSACVLARVNLTGTHLPISLNGDNKALGFSQSPEFPRQEGAYFGNVFSNPPVAYACKGRDADVKPIDGRLCIGQKNCPYVNAFPKDGGACSAGCTARESGTGYTACTVGGRTFSRPMTVWTH